MLAVGYWHFDCGLSNQPPRFARILAHFNHAGFFSSNLLSMFLSMLFHPRPKCLTISSFDFPSLCIFNASSTSFSVMRGLFILAPYFFSRYSFSTCAGFLRYLLISDSIFSLVSKATCWQPTQTIYPRKHGLILIVCGTLIGGVCPAGAQSCCICGGIPILTFSSIWSPFRRGFLHRPQRLLRVHHQRLLAGQPPFVSSLSTPAIHSCFRESTECKSCCV